MPTRGEFGSLATDGLFGSLATDGLGELEHSAGGPAAHPLAQVGHILSVLHGARDVQMKPRRPLCDELLEKGSRRTGAARRLGRALVVEVGEPARHSVGVLSPDWHPPDTVARVPAGRAQVAPRCGRVCKHADGCRAERHRDGAYPAPQRWRLRQAGGSTVSE